MLIRSDLGGDGWSTDLELDLWRQIVPVALDQDPEIRSELMNLDAHDQVGFYAMDELKSFFNLACVLSESRGRSPVVELAQAWMCIPLSERAAWDYTAFPNKSIHGQMLGRVSPAPSLYSAQVPSWLPNLLEATEHVCFRSGPVWKHAVTPLGASCVAYLDRAIDDYKACLALSTCPIHYELVDDERRSQALAAVDQLIKRFEALDNDLSLAAAISWEVSGHQLPLMSSTLDKWREDIRSHGDDRARSN